MLRPDITLHTGAVVRMRTLENVTHAITLSQEAGRKKQSRASHASYKGSESFTATKSLAAYRDMLLNGWPEGIDGVEGLDGLCTDRADKLGFTRNVGGAFPIVPAHLAGMPNSMLQPVLQPADSVRGLTLVIDSCFTGAVQSETVLTYAQTVMRMVAWLQAEQIDVSVYSIVPIMLAGRRYIYATPIRETGQVFQPERVASILHPSWLRRAWFALMEHEYLDYGRGNDRKYPECSHCNDGYGTVTHASAEEMQAALPEAYSVIMLPKVGTSNPENAIRETINLKLRRDV